MEHVDLRDQAARLRRLALAAVIAAVVTAVVMRWINSVSGAPNSDPVGSSTVWLLAIAMFVVTTAGLSSLFARLRTR